jgi:hypothetical protein
LSEVSQEIKRGRRISKRNVNRLSAGGAIVCIVAHCVFFVFVLTKLINYFNGKILFLLKKIKRDTKKKKKKKREKKIMKKYIF